MNKQKIAEWLVDNWYKIQFVLVFALVTTIICLCVRNYEYKSNVNMSWAVDSSVVNTMDSLTIITRKIDKRLETLDNINNQLDSQKVILQSLNKMK